MPSSTAPANDDAWPIVRPPHSPQPVTSDPARSRARQQADEMLAHNVAMSAVLAEIAVALDAFNKGGAHG
ncbi:hypothetical protein [Beijerinckia sp. L45]|uniref:hypothetical protein n=1 Tax=Beijerinckia sp. L45 TaxID=1641855 RepID=UPI00131ADBD4|nr:hypothetical protein [Beijerinckia sp. L45]